MKKFPLPAVAGTLALLGANAHAAIDTAVSTAITGAFDDTKAAVLLMIGGAVLVWAVRKLYSLFSGK
jgi:shikimate kinase